MVFNVFLCFPLVSSFLASPTPTLRRIQEYGNESKVILAAATMANEKNYYDQLVADYQKLIRKIDLLAKNIENIIAGDVPSKDAIPKLLKTVEAVGREFEGLLSWAKKFNLYDMGKKRRKTK